MNFNQTLYDRIIAHSLGIEKLKAGLAKKYAKQLENVDKAVLGLFIAAIGANRSEQDKLFRQIKELKAESYALLEKEMIAEMVKLAERQNAWLIGLFGSMLIPAMVNDTVINISQIENMEIRGRKIKPTLSDLRDSEINRLYVLARTAVTDGLTLKESKETFKALLLKRTNKIRAIAHTAVAGATVAGDRAMMRGNSHLIKGVRLSVVFDNRTTPICINHSIEAKVYPVDDYPQPPFHWNCRTRALPVVKSYAELGLKMKRKVPVSTRVSMTGDTTIDTNYAQWLKRQTNQIQNEALGRTRAEIFRRGELPLTKFIAPTGNFYNVDDLFNRYDI